MKNLAFLANLLFEACTRHPAKQEEYEAMKSRAELLAEIEENRLKNKQLEESIDVLSIVEPDTRNGHDPYDHPGQPKELSDDTDVTARRREIFLRYR